MLFDGTTDFADLTRDTMPVTLSTTIQRIPVLRRRAAAAVLLVLCLPVRLISTNRWQHQLHEQVRNFE
jgi:hypothetical protein